MPDPIPYKVGEDLYDIPEENINAFLEQFPNAVRVDSGFKSYKVGEDLYDIPEDREQKFLQQFPDAVSLDVKKKDGGSESDSDGQSTIPIVKLDDSEFTAKQDSIRLEQAVLDSPTFQTDDPISKKAVSESLTTQAGKRIASGVSGILQSIPEVPGFIQGITKGFVKNIPKVINAASFSLVRGQPFTNEQIEKFEQDVDAAAEQSGLGLLTSTIESSEFVNEWKKSEREFSEKIRSQTDFTEDSISGLIKEDRYVDALKATVLAVAESIPSLVTAATPGGLATLGVSTGASEFAESTELGLEEDRAALNGVVHGTAEALFERVSLGLLKGAGNQVQKALSKELLNSTKAGIAKSFGSIVKGATAEGSSEAATTLVQNLSDIVVGKVEFDNKEDAIEYIKNGVLDAFIVGAAIGGPIKTVGEVAKAARPKGDGDAKTQVENDGRGVQEVPSSKQEAGRTNEGSTPDRRQNEQEIQQEVVQGQIQEIGQEGNATKPEAGSEGELTPNLINDKNNRDVESGNTDATNELRGAGQDSALGNDGERTVQDVPGSTEPRPVLQLGQSRRAGSYTARRNANGTVIVKNNDSGKVTTPAKAKEVINTLIDKDIDILRQGKRAEAVNISDPQQAIDHVIETSENAIEIAQVWQVESEKKAETNKEKTPTDIIHDFFKSGKISEKALSEVFNNDVISEFKKKSRSIVDSIRNEDSVHEIIEGLNEENGTNITNDDVRDYLNKYRFGDEKYKPVTQSLKSGNLQSLESRFTTITGLPLNKDTAARIIDRAEQSQLEDEFDTSADLFDKEGKKKRQFFARLEKSNIRQEVKDGISNEGRFYTPISNDLTSDEVSAIVSSKGVDQSEIDVRDIRNGIKPRVRVAMGMELLDSFEKSGDVDRAIRLSDFLTKLGTDLGQGVQAFRIFTKHRPDSFIRIYRKAKKDTQAKAKKNKKEVEESTIFGLTKKQIRDKKRAAIEKFKKGGGIATSGGIDPQRIEALTEIGLLIFAEGARTFKDWSKKMRAELGNISDTILDRIWAKQETSEGKTLKDLSQQGDRDVDIPESVDPEVEALIFKKATDMNKMPEGFLKDQATVEIMDIINTDIRKDQGWFKRNTDIMFSLWYASILSSHETQMLNAGANLLNSLIELSLTGLYDLATGNPEAAAAVWQGWIKGLDRGRIEFNAVLQEGKGASKVGDKFDDLGALEGSALKGGWTEIPRLMRFVPRFMVGTDNFFYHGLAEARFHEEAARLAKEKGLKGKALRQEASKMLYEHSGKYEQALKKANKELDLLEIEVDKKFTSRDRKRRAYEIIEQGRPDSFKLSADRFAARGTFNYDPDGVLGFLAENIARASRSFPPIRFVVPFTRVVSNVLNQQLDFTPMGMTRGLGITPSRYYKKLKSSVGETSEERIKQFTKGLLGKIGLTTLLTMGLNDDEEDGGFEITGGGPRSTRRSQFFEEGKKLYSFRIGDRWISYQYTPAGLVLSIVGNYSDAIKYKNLDEVDASNRLAYGIMQTDNAVMEMSFLTGLSDLFKAMSKDATTDKSIEKSIKGPVRLLGTAIPNFFKGVDKLFDPTIYDASDIRQMIIKEIPVARSGLKPRLNIFGEPIQRKGNRFTSKVPNDPVIRFMDNKNVFIRAIGYDVQLNGEVMTEDQRYRFIKIVGKDMKKYIETNMKKWGNKSSSDIQALIDKKYSRVRTNAKRNFK